MLTQLQQAVISQLDIDLDDDYGIGVLQNISNHGIDGGFHGFVYHCDTVAFFDANRDVILHAAIDMAQDCGESVSDLVKGFNCLDSEDARHVDAVICGIECDGGLYVKNALAWFAAETVARELTDY